MLHPTQASEHQPTNPSSRISDEVKPKMTHKWERKKLSNTKLLRANYCTGMSFGVRYTPKKVIKKES